MQVNQTLDQVVESVRLEVGDTANAAVGANVDPQIRHLVKRVYRRLHADHDWPHLRIERDETLSAGQRFYTPDPTLDLSRVTGVWYRSAGEDEWRPLCFGIGPEQYNIYAPDERSDPVSRWDYAEGGQYEIWPTPAVAGTLRMIGIKKPAVLTAGTQVVDLDADLIMLYAAARLLRRQESDEANDVLEEARATYASLRANNSKQNVFPVAPSERRQQWTGVTVKAPRT